VEVIESIEVIDYIGGLPKDFVAALFHNSFPFQWGKELTSITYKIPGISKSNGFSYVMRKVHMRLGLL
jgi:hypothetical protein